MSREIRDGTEAIQCDRCGALWRAELSEPPFISQKWSSWVQLPACSVISEPEACDDLVDVCFRCAPDLKAWWEDWGKQWRAKLAEFDATYRHGPWAGP